MRKERDMKYTRMWNIVCMKSSIRYESFFFKINLLLFYFLRYYRATVINKWVHINFRCFDKLLFKLLKYALYGYSRRFVTAEAILMICDVRSY